MPDFRKRQRPVRPMPLMTTRQKTRQGTRRNRRFARLAFAAMAASGVAVGLFAACGPPPEGWEGAGRRYTLPAVNTALANADSGQVDSGSPPPFDSGLPPVDSGPAG